MDSKAGEPDVHKSVMLLLEHSQHLQELERRQLNDEIDDRPLHDKLEQLKNEIEEGIISGTIVPEMVNIVDEICIIQKELQIAKIKIEQEKAVLKYEVELLGDWHIVDDIIPDKKEIGAIGRLKNVYATTCNTINYIRQPIRPIFIALQWLITVYTTGLFSIIPIILKLLSQ